ncbi:hypothetical protein COHA_008975 [Chlorella ohadii]|uniref:Uncharacterized protein n=1 Tax=Chlorella ohadii TaxID=2649997 RepID=A0AAD5DFP6_9CHLO|nr:hypothetical protein COHA_008975 [Chlorella ohadii]
MCSYIESFVKAANQVGVGACVTAAVLNSTGAVQAWAQYHTLAPGPPAANMSSGDNSSSGGGGSGGGGSSGSSGSGGDGGSPGNSSSGDSPGGSSGSSGGSPGNSSSGELPPGDVESDWALSFDPVRCSTYTQEGQWVDDTQAWAGQGGTEVQEAAAQDLGLLICESPASVSGEALYAAFEQGGVAAEVAVAALLGYECPPGAVGDFDVAFNAFTSQPALYDAATAFRVANNFAAAADAVGVGACVSMAVLDAQGSLLKQVQTDPAVAFQEFAQSHNKAYLGDAAEYGRRRAAFEANVAKIVAHNARADATFTLGLNPHADLTTEEFKQHYFGARPADLFALRQSDEVIEALELQKHPKPSGPPSDPFPYSQEVFGSLHVGGAPCGCCYAFGGIAGVEAANTLYTGQRTTLSEQEIVSCDEYDYGCDGGDFRNVYRWVIRNGISADADWPYEAEVTACHHKRIKRARAVTVQGLVEVPRHNESALLQAVAHTPTVAAICCGEFLDQWHLYKSGIMGDSVQCTRPLDHSVLVAGYGTDEATGEQYWLIKNSWGSAWGEGGYVRLKRNQTLDRDGQAGLATFPAYVYKNQDNPGQARKLDVGSTTASTLQGWFSGWHAWLGSY